MINQQECRIFSSCSIFVVFCYFCSWLLCDAAQNICISVCFSSFGCRYRLYVQCPVYCVCILQLIHTMALWRICCIHACTFVGPILTSLLLIFLTSLVIMKEFLIN